MQYEQARDMDGLRKTLDTALVDYNETHAEMNLVLFDDAVLHIARIVRIIKNTGGHALLVGVGGSGKQTVNPTYSINDFKQDLQNMYNKAGLKQEGVLFLLTDAQIINEKFMVYLNDLLSSGNIPDLYNRDEKETIVNSLTNKAKGAGYTADPSSVWSYFISKIRENLHCCLCFSPVGPALRTRATRFPAIASCTKLAEVVVDEEKVKTAVEAFMPLAFVAVDKMCKTFLQKEGKHVYTTPKSGVEKLIKAEEDNEKAMVEAAKVAEVQAEVSRQQQDCAKDLAMAEPALMKAMAALDSLDKRDLGNCKTMTKPPPGVDDIFGGVMTGKVREKERTWDAAKKALLGNVNGFLDELKGFKQNVDEGTVAEINFREIRPFLAMPHFNPEDIE
eukprot:GSChrysophyteH1.ASY1.ANO1.1063.1 assembled CDS